MEDERMSFVVAHLEDEFPMSELCRAYGISRKTGYKWLNRYDADGIEGLRDQSRARRTQPARVGEDTERLIVEYRKRHPNRGPKKIGSRLQVLYPDKEFPAASTIGDIIKRHGLVKSRRRRLGRPSASPSLELTRADSANHVWACDFKGWFRLGNGQRCDPLTISDLHSRYIIRCDALAETTSERSRPVFESAFREYGLPEVIRSDNGAPFGAAGLAGLSRLSAWWIRLGIRPERIEPGKPEQNGCHERMHRTLKADATLPPARNHNAQQRVFNRFREDFNENRPHEAHGLRPPAQFYRPAERTYPRSLPEIDYPARFEVRRVRIAGTIKWRGQMLYLSQALVGQPVGLEPFSDRHWRIHFASYQIAVLDDDSRKILPYKDPTPTDPDCDDR